jgi:hypothetical protein
VLMAKNYIDNLSEEARKGMQEKAEQGIWPTKTPLGYRNITGPDGKKIIALDPALAPIVARLFDWYARGDISLKEAARKARTAGLLYPKSGAKVPVSTVHTLLRNRYGLVRMERQAHPGQARGVGAGRAVGACSARARRTLRQEGQARSARLRLFRFYRLSRLRLRCGRRDQEAAIHLLSLHGLRR